jgi:cytochrome c-type biogenesis protein CcmH
VKLLAVMVAALALATPAMASERHPTLAELEDQLMCPVCQGETLAQSDSVPAQRIKAHLQQRISQGWSRSRIINEEVDIWGTRILAAPRKHGFDLLAWVLPLVGIFAAAGILALLAWRWTRTREEPVPLGPASLNGRPLDPELEKRLDEELARFDG